MNSRQKGARGEREAAREWSAAMGGTARRGQQFAGGGESPDVITSHPLVHLECKRVERGNPYQWIDQAAADAGPKVPVVLHKRNRREWLLIVRLSDAPRLVAATQVTANSCAMGQEEVSAHPQGARLPPAELPG
jgi:hypothetical protein